MSCSLYGRNCWLPCNRNSAWLMRASLRRRCLKRNSSRGISQDGSRGVSQNLRQNLSQNGRSQKPVWHRTRSETEHHDAEHLAELQQLLVGEERGRITRLEESLVFTPEKLGAALPE